MSSQGECPLPIEALDDEKLCLLLQNRVLHALEDINSKNQENVMKPAVVAVVILTLMGHTHQLIEGELYGNYRSHFHAFVNNLSESNPSKDANAWYKTVQTMLAYTFEYNMAVVIIGVLVPLLRVLARRKTEVTRKIVMWLGFLSVIGLTMMFVAFILFVRANFTHRIYISLTIVALSTVLSVVSYTWGAPSPIPLHNYKLDRR
ncbi:hypothetical protein BDV93DRAFT_549605 [Ceratobasidium sp. AG-I]|nr:hypothetical protein BDV93DRAFT_549605 [Ceratobasidium sp. AG-I]